MPRARREFVRAAVSDPRRPDRALPVSPAEGLQGRAAHGADDGSVREAAKPRGHVRSLCLLRAQKLKPGNFKVDDKRAARGKAKADETLCTMCHLGGFMGQNEIPRVAGQHYEYVVKQMKDFKNYRRTNDAGNMTAVAKTLSDQDIEDLGHYLTSLR
jgi:cytochrome c553